MGGVGIGLAEPYGLVPSNPATYAGLMRPCFEIGGVGHLVRLGDGEVRNEHASGRFLGLSLGVPFGNGRWGLAMGLQPVSEVGYSIEDHATLPDGDDVQLEYRGTGGINRVYGGLAWVPWQQRDSLGNGHRISIGGNFNYLFGTMDQLRTARYPPGEGYFNTSVYSGLVVGDAVGTTGLQYHGDLVRRRTEDDEAWRYTVGIVAEFSGRLNAHRNEVVSNFQTTPSGISTTYDTIHVATGVPVAVDLPPAYGFGLSIHDDHWTFAAEARARDWSGVRTSAGDTMRVGALGTQITYSLGAAWRPAGDRLNGTFLQRTVWRMGLRYADDYLIVDGRQLAEMGFSFGCSLPILGTASRSRFHLGAELGRRGADGEDQITEQFADLYFGLTFTPDMREVWFRKRRIE